MAQALLILKPDAAHRLAVRHAVDLWLREQETALGVSVTALTWYQPAPELIEEHYDFLKERPFFPWLVDFMSALPVVVGRVEAEPDTLEKLRWELGETMVQQARPGSLRERCGIFGGVNCLHLSDSAESGEREVSIWSTHVSLDKRDADLSVPAGTPDHTYRLRSLATQVSAGIHRELAMLAIQELLEEECQLEGQDLKGLGRIILGAFA